MKLLVVRTDFLGDAILSSTVLEMLASYAHLKIDALMTKYNSAAWRYCPVINELIELEHRPDNKKLATNPEVLNGRSYDLVLVLNRDLRTFCYLKRVKFKQVVAFRLGRRSFKANLFCSLAGLLPSYQFINYDETEHEVINLAAVTKAAVARLGCSSPNLPLSCKFYMPSELFLPPKIEDGVAINLSGRAGTLKYINDGLAIGILSLLSSARKCAVIVTSSDFARAQRIVALFPKDHIVIISHDDLFEVANELRSYSYFIGADGGLLHLAAGLGLNCIGIFHNQKLSNWHPWTSREYCIQSKQHNIYDISPFTVVDALQRFN